MTVPVVVDIDFDLRYKPVHFRNMVAMVVVVGIVAVDVAAVVVVAVVERIPNELVLQFVRATNWMDFEREPELFYRLRCHQ